MTECTILKQVLNSDFPLVDEIVAKYNNSIERILSFILTPISESYKKNEDPHVDLWWQILLHFWEEMRDTVNQDTTIVSHEAIRKTWKESEKRDHPMVQKHVKLAVGDLMKYFSLPDEMESEIKAEFEILGVAFIAMNVTNVLIYPDFESAHMSKYGEWRGERIPCTSFEKKQVFDGTYNPEKTGMIIVPQLVRARWEDQRDIFGVAPENKIPFASAPEKYVCY